MLEDNKLKILLEAILLAAAKPMTEDHLLNIFSEEERPSIGVLRQALCDLQSDLENRGIELVQVASGYRFQVRPEWAPWISRLWEEKAQKYSRALLETLALIAYRQPVTRGEIENIRGVSISTSTFKILLEDREWIRVVGHKEVPGRPALYATTKAFLDYFGLKSLQNLPALPEIMNLDTVTLELNPENLETATVDLSGSELEMGLDPELGTVEVEDIEEIEEAAEADTIETENAC